MFNKSIIKIFISVIYTFFVLIKVTDYLSGAVSYKTDALVKIDSNLKIEKAYLLPNEIKDFYLFYEASGDFMCNKKEVFLNDSFILLNNITPSIINFIGEKKNHSIQTFKMKYNKEKDYYEIDLADKPSPFNNVEYVLYHFFKFIVTVSLLLIILLCFDYYIIDSCIKYKKLNLAISIALSLIAAGLPYFILLKTYFPIN